MNIKNITIMVEPLQPGEIFISTSSPNPKTVHDAANYTRFYNEVKAQEVANVVLIEDFLQVAPLNEFVILYPRHRGLDFEQNLNTCQPKLQETLPQRLVLLNVIRPANELLSQYPLAAIVEDLHYNNWWNIEHLSPPQQRMYGFTAVAKEIGASFWFEQGQYCQMIGEKFERLPTLLIRYLEAYAKMFPEILQ